jgi:nucleoside-diphosphate-sugar epimerase
MFSAPLVEELADQLPEDYAKTVSYPHYRAMLTQESADKSWTWCEVCPDAIIGFTPNGSGYSLAGHWAIYLYAYKLVHGEGAEVPYPGVQAGYDALYSETSATTLARVAIYASLHPEQFRKKIFNVADSTTPSSMRERWPQIASWFGLKGVPPPESASVNDQKPSDFVKESREALVRAGVKGVDIWNPGQLDSYGYWLTFDRHLSLKRLRDSGFKEERRPDEGWWEAFNMFQQAGMIRQRQC